MSAVDLTTMCGQEIAGFLRRTHPRFTDEMVLRDLERHGYTASLRTIAGWIAGNMPGSRHLTALINVYGVPLIQSFAAPALREGRTIEQELADLENQIKRIRTKQAAVLRQLGRDDERLAQEPRASSGQ